MMKITAYMLAALLALPNLAAADEAKGRIKYISKKASTIQLAVKGKEPVVVRFDKNTVFENATGIKDLGPPDLLKVEFEPGKPASKITKVVFGLPPGVEIDIKDIKYLKPAEMDEAFLQRYQVENEGDLRDRVRDNLQEQFESRVRSEMSDQVYKHLLDNTKFDLPLDIDTWDDYAAVCARFGFEPAPLA